MRLSRLSWYWHRLRAMSPAEMGAHARNKIRRFTEARKERDWAAVQLENPGPFPRLPAAALAPEVLREGLRRDADAILGGHWRAFGHLEIKVDDPPRWHMDYLVGKDLATNEPAFNLNYRELPDGADIKLIWELSRWHELVRLAQAAYVLDDAPAAEKCVRWLQDWVTHNPPYRGWNWTSALEVGMRLVQFTWIDALLSGQAEVWGLKAELERLRREVLPAHVWFTWRYRSFGSSANNHLLGELAGLILATARWPSLEQCGASLENLQTAWEREVLAQFAEDGGNREQALNYHLFAWELCWQARLALGSKIDPRVEERLAHAARFFWVVQVRREPWDYGDSDNAFTTPFFAAEQTALVEWRDWIVQSPASVSLDYWLGDSPCAGQRLSSGRPLHTVAAKEWWVYPETGLALCSSGFWWLRWDLSPLGYLKTAAHGHLDALHLSMWFKGVAMIIDPGTGAYYADRELRSWLASRSAHNGPCPIGEEYPERLGPFLWGQGHPQPVWRLGSSAEAKAGGLTGKLPLLGGTLRRRITRQESGDGWQVEDEYDSKPGIPDSFTVRWQFGPGAWVKRLGEREFALNRDGVSVQVEVGPDWAEVELVEALSATASSHIGSLTPPEPAKAGTTNGLEGVVSPAFRKTVFAPYLKLTARGAKKPCVFRTTFLACEPS